MSAAGYVFDQAWTLERTRLAGLEAALDTGTRQHLARLGAGRGSRLVMPLTVAAWGVRPGRR